MVHVHIMRFLGALSLLLGRSRYGTEISSFLVQGLFCYFYRFLFISVLFYLIGIRFSYLFVVLFFGLFMVFVVAPSFGSLFLFRFFREFYNFFASFVPFDTPYWLAPFVCIVELISYWVRPVIMWFRLFINLNAGSLFLAGSGYLIFSYFSGVFVWGVLFFYEVFVAGLQWFILCCLMAFSKSH